MLPYPVLLLTAAVGIVGSNSLVLSPIAGAVATSFDTTGAADVVVAGAVYGIATAISALALAPQADRIGAARALWLALALLAGAVSTPTSALNLVAVLGRSTAGAGFATLAYGTGFGLAVVLDGLIDRHAPAPSSRTLRNRGTVRTRASDTRSSARDEIEMCTAAQIRSIRVNRGALFERSWVATCMT